MLARTRGWFDLPGIRRGERTIEEQMLGLEHALAEANGKTVLDLGCAEGLISIEFAKVGAKVTALEQFDVHAKFARHMFKDYPDIEFVQSDYQIWEPKRTFDIVLALSVVHKAINVREALLKVISLTAQPGLLVLRWPVWIRKDFVLRSKVQNGRKVDTVKELNAHGFVPERLAPGPREEIVHYWRSV